MTGALTRHGPARPAAAAACGALALSVVLSALLTFGPARVQSPGSFALTTAMVVPAVVMGCLVAWRVPRSPVGGALAWVGAAPAVVGAIEDWGQTLDSAHPWPGAAALFVLKQGVWVWNLAGFVALCLVFPDGPLRGRVWRRLPWLCLAAALVLNAAVSLDPGTHQVDGVTRVGSALHLSPVPRVIELVLAAGLFLAALFAVAGCVVVRVRRADDAARRQLRWLLAGAATVPLLLGAGWIAGLAGVPQQVWTPGFFVAMLLVMPTAVAVAILRHDLYDVDRLLGSSLAVVLTSVVSAGVFAGIVYVAEELFGPGSAAGVTGAAFGTALCLMPMYRAIHRRVGGIFDRERMVMHARVGAFVTRVRDGLAEPEEVQGVLRAVLEDPDLHVLFRLPGGSEDGYVDLAGNPADRPHAALIPLLENGSDVAAIVLGMPSTRRTRQARELAMLARLPIEVSRLRLELRVALRDVRATQARLAIAGADERHRLERDLHDGAQQHFVAVGMRLRSIQRRLGAEQSAYTDLDQAVEMIEAGVAELRRLAHGVRPSLLHDGLRAALRDLLAASPIPVELEVTDVDLPEALAATSYFVVAECAANAYKHAHASLLDVRILDGAHVLAVTIRDDGVGGAQPAFGLTSVRDRVEALGGILHVDSPLGAGTTIHAELPCAS